MANTVTKLPVRTQAKEGAPAAKTAFHPVQALRREVERVFDDFSRVAPFGRGLFEFEPFWRRELSFGAMPAVDIVEKDKAYEVEAELPGMDEKNVEIALSDGTLTIKGEKQEDTEQIKKNYYLSERHYGAFQRAFRLPAGVDADRIEATFARGVLKITLPKTAEAQKKEKKIDIKLA